ncbi:hypothetical protein [Azospira inquinata]|uniref:Uncharacterized protein n=1 Tax=Azospira inquinata TaxID=2785627 RepID=A0A975SPW1_9RHOO|nr:hypothetical protein [Azospira inquinata]QWT47048.1 hypothetical protein J8L76_04885 [Azospira inquinata]QWT50322.1 hypothetical protein Azoinq_06985 [Azospira inquinata]
MAARPKVGYLVVWTHQESAELRSVQMHNHFSSTHIEYLRRQAKKLSKTDDIPLSKALDLIAQQNGWSNWSLLVKNRLPDDSPDNGYQLRRTRDEFIQAIRKFQVKQPRRGRVNRYVEVLRQTEDICNRFVSAKNAIKFAVSYIETLLKVPRFQVQVSSLVDVEMHRWLPYCLVAKGNEGQILLNRKYKPVGLIGDTWVNYEDFPHLQTHLKEEQLWDMSHPKATTPGFFYYDGDSPWRGRAEASAYLERLKIAQSLL